MQSTKHPGLVILLIFLICSFTTMNAQTFSSVPNKDKITLEGKPIEGFSIGFDYSGKEVEKGWWKYCRSFGRPINMRTYYKVTIPSEENGGNVDLELLSKVFASKGDSKFFLGLNPLNIPDPKQEVYHRQIRSLVADFKKRFYLNDLENQLRREEKKTKRLSKKVDRGNDQAFEALIRQEKVLDRLRDQIGVIYNAP